MKRRADLYHGVECLHLCGLRLPAAREEIVLNRHVALGNCPAPDLMRVQANTGLPVLLYRLNFAVKEASDTFQSHPSHRCKVEERYRFLAVVP